MNLHSAYFHCLYKNTIIQIKILNNILKLEKLIYFHKTNKHDKRRKENKYLY